MKSKTRLALLAVVVIGAAFVAIDSAKAAIVTVAWDDNSAVESGFKVERALGLTPADSAFVVIGTTQANATSFVDTTAAEGTAYAYRVRCFLGTTFSAYSNTATITVPLAAPTNTKATSTPPLVVNIGSGQSITVKNSSNVTRPGSKTFNVAPGKQLLVSSN